jgi:hypothetical protein
VIHRPDDPFRRGGRVGHRVTRAFRRACGERIWDAEEDAKCCELLLVSTNDRDTDAFLEVHIYGSFNHQAVKAVKLGLPGAADELTDKKKAVLALRLQELQETLDLLGIEWSWA